MSGEGELTRCTSQRKAPPEILSESDRDERKRDELLLASVQKERRCGKAFVEWEGGQRRGARTEVTLGSRDGESAIFGVSTGKGRVWGNGRLCTV